MVRVSSYPAYMDAVVDSDVWMRIRIWYRQYLADYPVL